MVNVKPVLVVDLDGTLIHTDLLYETFCSACSTDWLLPFKALSKLASGKAQLKEYLNDCANTDITTLPYNEQTIEYIKKYRKNGGKTALVTASNQELAKEIADHLGLFDEVHGSSTNLNLKGKNKASFLKEHFGKETYIYMGDAAPDLPVWKGAQKAVTINASASLRKKAESVNKNCEHLNSNISSMRSYIKALRPHQWLKNILVFLPMFAAHQLTMPTLINSLIAFVAFSFVASSVYITNDLLDLNVDRAHPRKKKRPFASGAVPISHGIIIALFLFITGVITAYYTGLPFLAALLIYYAITTAYSLKIKRLSVIDIFTLAALYTMRVIGGGTATEIELSFWLLAFSIFIFLSLAAVKRQAELVDLQKRGTLAIKGRGYRADDLPLITMLAMGADFASILVMALYINSPAVMALYPTPSALWGVCCILLYWLTRMVFITHRGNMHDDPIIFAVKDKVSLFCFLLIAALVLAGALL